MQGAGLARVEYPFEIGRGEQVSLDMPVPNAQAVPNGFVYVPPGPFWFGDADEQLRAQFLDTVPIHRRATEAFLIARTETTYAEWIAFLEALPPTERARHSPNLAAFLHGSLRLQQADGAWRLAFEPSTKRYAANSGEPIIYAGRHQRARQDWQRFPIAGVSRADADRYLSWLRSTKRVPGARLCTEMEWERAARGADDRLFPHGDELLPDDANFDLTYGRVDSAYGPDVVGAHPTSRSPFGVDDLAGNLFELVSSSEEKDAIVLRGGAYYFGAASARSTNRLSVPAVFRDATTGLRVCASLQENDDVTNH